jgi:hypothetical protein
LYLPGDADGHADHGDSAADHACADADTDVDTVRAGTGGGDRLPSSDGLTCRNPMTAGERAVGYDASAGSGLKPLPELFRQRLLPPSSPSR